MRVGGEMRGGKPLSRGEGAGRAGRLPPPPDSGQPLITAGPAVFPSRQRCLALTQPDHTFAGLSPCQAARELHDLG